MFAKELNKVFIKQKGIYFLLVLFLIKIGFVVISGYDSHYMIDENEAYYLDYMRQYEGKITEQKEWQLEEEYEKTIYMEDDLLASEQKKKAFQVIYTQFTYQRENGGGYLLDTRGWQSILEHDELDICLIICIVILNSMIFCTEYESEMDMLLASSKKGKYHATKVKIALGLLIGAVLSFVFQMVNIVYLWNTVGLSHGEAPLKCLEMFEGTYYDISLQKAVMLVVGVKILGYVMLAAVVMLIAILVKKKSLSIIISFFVMLMCEIIFSKGEIGYYLPLPLGMCRGSGYLWNDIYRSFIDEQGNMIRRCVFHAIKPEIFVACIIIFCVETVIICGLSLAKFSKWQPHVKILKKVKHSDFILLLLFLATMLSGCNIASGESIALKIEISYDQSVAHVGQATLEVDNTINNIVYTNAEGEQTTLIRDVFPLEESVRKIFVYQGVCYYLLENDNDTGICVRKINLETFSDDLVYTSLEENIEDYYGLLTEEKSEEEIFDEMEETKWFFVSQKYIYLKKKFYIKQIDINSGVSKIIAEHVADENIVYDNGTIIYTDANGIQCTYEER